MKLVIVTGMSGAGKTIALKMLEDIGFYCVDNLPISLVDKFVQLVSEGTSIEKAALGLDIRSGEELGNLDEQPPHRLAAADLQAQPQHHPALADLGVTR